METRRLGTSGLIVSRACLGTMTFGDQCDEATSRAILERASEHGVTFIDTADVYPASGDTSTVGLTEEIVGRWLKGRRHDFIVATKCFAPTSDRAWDRGSSRKHVLDAVDASLRRLGTDYIDLYQLHGWDEEAPLTETLGVLRDLVRMGKVRYAGVSNWLAWQLGLGICTGRSDGGDLLVSAQPRYNLLFREFERELFPLCRRETIGILPYNPLAGGILTGKYSQTAPLAANTRFGLQSVGESYQDRYWNDRAFVAVDRLKEIARAAGIPLTTLAVAWVLANPAVTSVVIGASRPDQLQATLAATDVVLDDDLKAELDGATVEFRYGDASR